MSRGRDRFACRSAAGAIVHLTAIPEIDSRLAGNEIKGAGLGCGRFSFAPGTPDLHLPGRAWIEVKDLNHSDDWRERWNRSGGDLMSFATPADQLHAMVPTKLQEDWDDAMVKFARVSPEPVQVVYFSVRLGFGALPRVAWQEVTDWLRRLSIPSGVGVVLANKDDWRSPVRVRGANPVGL